MIIDTTITKVEKRMGDVAYIVLQLEMWEMWAMRQKEAVMAQALKTDERRKAF